MYKDLITIRPPIIYPYNLVFIFKKNCITECILQIINQNMVRKFDLHTDTHRYTIIFKVTVIATEHTPLYMLKQ